MKVEMHNILSIPDFYSLSLQILLFREYEVK